MTAATSEMYLLELNKWILGSGLCTALAVGAGLLYLLNVGSGLNLAGESWPHQALLLLFCAMLLTALLLNVLALFGRQKSPQPSAATEAELQQRFAVLVSRYLARQHVSVSFTEANCHLHQSRDVLYVVHQDSGQPVDIVLLRQVFQLMLKYQCHSAQILAPSGLQSPAQFFALEANIRVLNFAELEYRLAQQKTDFDNNIKIR